MASFTPVDSISQIHAAHKATFLSHSTRDLAWRKTQLKQLGFLLQDNEEAFVEAVRKDLARPQLETIIAEVNYVKSEINESLTKLIKWATPRSVQTEGIWRLTKAKMYTEPKGSVLIIGAWNYPISLLLGPLVGAISAGCTAVIKPSDVAVNVGTLIAALVPKYLDTSAYTVVVGAVPETTELLRLQWDHIFYTGSGSVGKIIARAAAEHLTPITLELGGKSPVLVLDDANVKVAGRRLAWSQWVNSAQTCIAPDYILCTRAMQPKLIAAFKSALVEFSGSKTALLDQGYTSIINDSHFARVSKLLDNTSGKIVAGGKTNKETRKIEVTLVGDVTESDELLKSENFGPVLPILVKETMDEMIAYVNAHDQPLALYIFTNSSAHREYIFNRTRSGSCVVNDSLVQFSIPGLAFGGTGPSGIGSYHGIKSFLTFSHERASAVVPNYLEPVLSARYPPYNQKKLNMLLMATRAVITGRPGAPKAFPLGFLLRVIALLGVAYSGYKKFA